jgi:CubicO group peptidase (beta-lactamase class C family)
VVAAEYRDAHWGLRVPNTTHTQFAMASGSKGLTALAVGWLLRTEQIGFETTAREVLGDLLPRVHAAVAIRHLLGHTSGVGDYLDEEVLDDVDAYLLSVPVHQLAGPRGYLPLLDGPEQKFPPGARFSYSNSGYVILSLIVELVTGDSFYDVVQRRVLDPAGMRHTGYHRSDELPGAAALGYLSSPGSDRTNVFHLPVRGAGDGGAYSTCADLQALWAALFTGRILPPDLVQTFLTAHTPAATDRHGYGYGFWLRRDQPTVMPEGSDAGVSFRSAHDRDSGLTYTVMSNTSTGAWPLVRHLDDRLPALADAAIGAG